MKPGASWDGLKYTTFLLKSAVLFTFCSSQYCHMEVGKIKVFLPVSERENVKEQKKMSESFSMRSGILANKVVKGNKFFVPKG